MANAFIIDAVRTARGKKKNGSLNGTHPVDLGAHVLNALVERNGLDPSKVDDVTMGCVTQVGEQGCNIGRASVLAAGYPVEVAGNSVNRFCGSGQQSVNYAAQAIMAGVEGVMIGGGVESMSRVPMGADMLPPSVAPPGTGGPVSPQFAQRFPGLVPQGVSAEMVADKWGLSRNDLDSFAAESQRKATIAIEEGRFKNEIAPIDVDDGEGGTRRFDQDEHVRSGTTVETLGTLRTVFRPDGVITAGNSSGIVDGAAAVLVAGEEQCQALGLKPRARVVTMAVSGSEPVIMLTGPMPSTRKALQRAGMTMGDIDLVEINEAFASVPLAVCADLDIDQAKVNVNGGAIALGHPLGATGAMLIGTLLNELERSGSGVGLVTMCIGYGMGITTIIERV